MSLVNNLEADPRFPSGPWIGFFLDKRLPGKHWMDLNLTFQDGKMVGDGSDKVGKFVIDGNYDLADGKCQFKKTYLGRHSVDYNGFNEGKGIWGTWLLVDQGARYTGGFHIWPKGMPDPTQLHLSEEADIPIELDLPQGNEKLQPLGV
jgi:hypothetical protein